MSNAVINSTTLNEKTMKFYNISRWPMIVIFFVLSVIPHFLPANNVSIILSGISTLVVFAIAFLHCKERYGFKNAVIFLIITWIVSNALEGLSIQVGFPFGYYYYTVPTARILNVPLIIMPAYFGMGYMAWTLSHVFNGQYGKRLKGINIVSVPLIASFIMVMWDVVMDPIESTLNKNWIWKDDGNYFGVPISNYLGWFFVVFVFFQIFAIYISKYDTSKDEIKKGKKFWLEAAAIYGIQCASLLLTSLIMTGHREVYSSMGLVNVFTMLFVTILSIITIVNSQETDSMDGKLNSIQHKVIFEEQRV